MPAAPIRWGILGLGSIAHKFASGLTLVPDATLAAVGSRSTEKAAGFAHQWKAERFHGSYEALIADPGVDAIYIATPHPLHDEEVLACLRAGKAVLCEKPFTVNARQLAALCQEARRLKVFLMEAMWTRFLPIMGQVRQWLGDGAIGEPRMLTADFGFRCAWDPRSRLLAPELAGGSLLDVGIYTVSLASMVYGSAASRVTGFAHLGSTGVDEQAAMVLGYEHGRLALLSCAVQTQTSHEARIDGTHGRITIPAFYKATTATLTNQEGSTSVELPLAGNGYCYEAAEVGRCLRGGLIESPTMPLDESLAIMRTLDELRRQWGLVYPADADTALERSALANPGAKRDA